MAILTPITSWETGEKQELAAPSFVGAVLKTWVRVDSLFEADHLQALVWDARVGKPLTLTVGGRQWGMGCYNEVPESVAVVDATPDVQAAYETWQRLQKQTSDTQQMYWDSVKLRVGSTVKVVSGRKIKRGTVGTVTRTGKSDYGEWAIVNGTLTNVSNLEVIPDLSWWTE